MSRFDMLNPRPADWHPENDARAILDAAIAEHEPSQVYVLFSGGRDSWCAARIACEHPRFSGVVFINTGTGADDAVKYVRSVGPGFGGEFVELSLVADLHKKPNKWGVPPTAEWDGDDPMQLGLFLGDACEFRALDRELRERVA